MKIFYPVGLLLYRPTGKTVLSDDPGFLRRDVSPLELLAGHPNQGMRPRLEHMHALFNEVPLLANSIRKSGQHIEMRSP